VVTLDTSGTTGKPKRCYFTRADQDLTIDFFGVGMTTLVSLDDRVLILLPCELAGSVGDLLQIGLQRRGITAVRHEPVIDPVETLRRMDEEKITALVGVPVQVLALARIWQRMGEKKCTPPRRILLSTDHVPDAIVSVLKNIWGCEVFNHYGMTEMGLGGGVSCRAQMGYHLREADFYFEIVDPKTGIPLPDGETGEVVFTTLTRQGMPFIRYRTGDLSRFIPEPCPCGTGLKTLSFLRRRISGMIPLGGESLAISDLDEALFPLEGLIDYSAEIYHETDHSLLSLEFFFLPNEINTDDEILRNLQTDPSIDKAIQSGALHVIIKTHDTLPPTMGSMRKRTIPVYSIP
jgi:phenylacetate-coenzyme A ligase PaaK-like adenylate-forming protein